MADPQFVVCISNIGYEVSLDLRKLYQLVSGKETQKHHQVRIIDESGEDYLYPESYFFPVALSGSVAQQVAHAA